jgi:YD repeat-containing protein
VSSTRHRRGGSSSANNNQLTTVKDAVSNLTTLVRDGYDRVSQVQFPLPTAGSNASNIADS